MAAILKYQLDITDLQAIKLPASARFLSVQDQIGTLCLWAFVQTPAEPKQRIIRIVGTGHELPNDFMDKHSYIGTAQDQDAFVWHVFEQL